MVQVLWATQLKQNRFDLNLLIHLHALLTEQHVTRAAQSLGITQPAMSTSLAKLRKIFDDPLLVRRKGGRVRSLRGEELLMQVNSILSEVDALSQSEGGFDLARSHRHFSLIGTDIVEMLLLQRLSSKLDTEAPGVTLRFYGPNPLHMSEFLADGKVDVAIGNVPEAYQELIRHHLFDDRFVCIFRKSHPRLGNSITLDQFCRESHVQVHSAESTTYSIPIDKALSFFGCERRITIWQPSFFSAASVVAASDYVACVPRRFALMIQGLLPGLEISALPFETDVVRFNMYWHARSQNDAAHKWLRARIIEILGAI